MVEVYILINTKPGYSVNLRDEIIKMENVEECHVVSGPYDIIALVKAKDFNSLGDFVVGTIQNMEGVERTITCPIFSSMKA